MSDCLVSICIPCYKRIDYVLNTLNSFYVDNSDVSLNEYEIVISDNDPEGELYGYVRNFERYSNFHYYQSNCQGFMNSYKALCLGKGKFLKLHNSQNLIRKGYLKRMINEIKSEENNLSLIYYSNGFLSLFKSIRYSTFEEFMQTLSYWSSWSGGFGIWKSDFEFIKDIEINVLFPHTTILLTQYNKKRYVINDNVFYTIQRVKKRGDHNKFKAFTIDYPMLINNSFRNGHITAICYNSILRDIVRSFLPSLLFNKYIAGIETYEIDGYRDNLKLFFPKGSFCITLFNIMFVPYRILIRRIKFFLYKDHYLPL